MIRDQPFNQPLKLNQIEPLKDFAISQQADLIIEKLHEKFNHRLRLGYYCYFPSSRKRLYQSSKIKDISKKGQIRNKNPIVRKKLKKNANRKFQMIDEEQATDEILLVHQEQTTDQVLLADQEQNTSLPQIQEEDRSMQWSCQETVIDQKEQSIQYQAEVSDREQQFPLPEETPKYQEASIQYEQQQKVQLPKIITKNTEMQCDINKPVCINESCEVKPEVKERKIQIRLPDPKYQEKIEHLNAKIKQIRQEQHKQINIRKKVSHQLQIIKLKKILSQLEGKIDLVETKEDYTRQKLQRQIAIKKRQEQFLHQKQQLRAKYQSECKMQLNKVIEKIKSTQPNRQSLPKPPKSEITDNQEDSLSMYKNEFNNLKEDLKKQMIKRLKVEQEVEEDPIEYLPVVSKHRSSFQLNYLTSKRQMPILQYPKRKQFIGSIVKNVLRNPEQNEQRSSNKYSQDAELSRAYWRQKSSFDYKYESDFEKRLSRKQKYLQKLEL